MDIRTYRAGSMFEALQLVRRDLGPDAAVLHTRQVRTSRWFGLLPGREEVEVTASAGVNVPSRLPPEVQPPPAGTGPRAAIPTPPPCGSTPPVPGDVSGKLDDVHSMLRELYRRSQRDDTAKLPELLFHLFTDLIEADIDEEYARELVERLRAEASGSELSDPVLVRTNVVRLIEQQIAVTGGIEVRPGQRRLVALVGPTGVGKTTTIAKLAANFRLRDKRSVGLITVDTYRIAAVEQLRTYADIIDLPMEVVSTPREMRDAVRRLERLDLVLMDTAGRSPKDEIKIQELRAFLSEARADEVHLVLSSGSSARCLEQTARQFATVGTTALILTKLDETTALGNLLPLLRTSSLPLSYVTNGQNVPDDIETATADRLARLILGMQPVQAAR